MKRIIGTVIGLAAVLAFGTSTRAATVNFNVSATGSVTSVSQFGDHTCGANPCYVNPFAPGSSVSVDITGGAVSLLSGTLNVVGTNSLAALGSIDVNTSSSLTGGTGVLSGTSILWFTPTSVATSGSFTLHGAICGIVGAPCDTPLPIAALASITMTVAVNPVSLGVWDLNSTLDAILGSNQAVISTGGPNPPPGPGLPAQWYLFGSNDKGSVPEPGALVLVALGLGALSLRSRQA
jgi:hypothetical protein